MNMGILEKNVPTKMPSNYFVHKSNVRLQASAEPQAKVLESFSITRSSFPCATKRKFLSAHSSLMPVETRYSQINRII